MIVIKKDKIIIYNNTDLSDVDVVTYIAVVLKNGKVSKTDEGEQYTFVTEFKDNIVVYSGRKGNTYRFVVERI